MSEIETIGNAVTAIRIARRRVAAAEAAIRQHNEQLQGLRSELTYAHDALALADAKLVYVVRDGTARIASDVSV